MHKALVISSLFFIIFFFNSCHKSNRWDCFKGNGHKISETRTLSQFETIRINNFFDIYLIQGELSKVVIESYNNIAPLIETKIENNTLYISNKNKCNWARQYKTNKIYIYSPRFKHIFLEKECKLHSVDTIVADTFHIDVRASVAKVEVMINARVNILDIHAGTGDFTYYGKVSNNYLYCHGTAYVDCRNLSSTYSGINHQTTGDFFVNCSGILDISLFGAGNIYYTGNPEKINIISNSSSGKILPL